MKKKNSKKKEVIYSEIGKKYPDSFYQEIVEKENAVALSNKVNLKTVEELIQLYKKVIEYYALISNEKVAFFSKRLAQLYIKLQEIENIENLTNNTNNENSNENLIKSYQNKHKQNIANSNNGRIRKND